MTTISQRSTDDLPRWMYILRGVFAIVFGILTLAWPGLSLVVLVVVYGAYALVEGAVAIILGFMRRGDDDHWWAIVLGGLLGVAAGVVVFVWPAITALALVYIIAAWALANGIMQIIAAFSDGWYLAIFGVLSILLGLFILFRPLTGALALAWAIGWWAIVAGVAFIVHAFMRRPVATAATLAG